MSSKSKKRNDVTTEIVVGAFMFIILVVLLTVSVVISQNRFFDETYTMQANFPQVGGLKEGEPVYLRGVKVGLVEDISIPEDDEGVNVTMKLDKKFDMYEDYEILVEVASMLGGMKVVIDEGSHTLEPLDEEELQSLEGEPVRDVMKKAAKLLDTLEKGLVKEGALDDLNTVTENLAVITDRVRNGEGTIGRLVKDDSLYNDSRKLVGDLGNAARDFEKVASDAKVISGRLSSGKGTLGKLLSEEEETYNNLTNILEQVSLASADVRKIAERLEKGEGSLGKLLSEDDTLYEDLQAAVGSLKDVSASLSKETGTIGRLINDDTLYIKVESLVEEARATIDDFRETSPITTFSSVFFGAF